MDLAAVGAAFSMRCLGATVSSKGLAFRVVTDMAGLYYQHVLAVGRMGAVPVGSNNTTDHAVIERKATEVFGHHDDRVTLAFIGTECARRHDLAGFETL